MNDDSVVMLADLVKSEGSAEGVLHYALAAPVQEAVLVHSGSDIGAGLLLEDGSVVMLPWVHLGPLAKLLDDWRRMFTNGEEPPGEGVPYSKDISR